MAKRGSEDEAQTTAKKAKDGALAELPEVSASPEPSLGSSGAGESSNQLDTPASGEEQGPQAESSHQSSSGEDKDTISQSNEPSGAAEVSEKDTDGALGNSAIVEGTTQVASNDKGAEQITGKAPTDEKNKNTTEDKSSGTKAAENDKPAPPVSSGTVGGFGAFRKPSGFSSGAFGGGIKFGSASSVNIFANPTSKVEEEESKKPSEEPLKGLDKQLETRTGEEHEGTQFSTRVKAYAIRLDATESPTWKERGAGTLKLNSDSQGRSRAVLRADGVLRVAVNLPLVAGTAVLRGFKGSLSSEKFVRVGGIEDGHQSQFAFKCANVDAAEDLYEALKNLLPQEDSKTEEP